MRKDVLVNFDGSGAEILRRFDAARRGRSILLGAEPFCWLSEGCTQEEMRDLYPNASRGYSRCPGFINSGMYIGLAEPLLAFLALWMRQKGHGDQASAASRSALHSACTPAAL